MQGWVGRRRVELIATSHAVRVAPASLVAAVARGYVCRRAKWQPYDAAADTAASVGMRHKQRTAPPFRDSRESSLRACPERRRARCAFRNKCWCGCPAPSHADTRSLRAMTADKYGLAPVPMCVIVIAGLRTTSATSLSRRWGWRAVLACPTRCSFVPPCGMIQTQALRTPSMSTKLYT
jgi:hypothetical protein